MHDYYIGLFVLMYYLIWHDQDVVFVISFDYRASCGFSGHTLLISLLEREPDDPLQSQIFCRRDFAVSISVCIFRYCQE